jgi:hypothetical protein
MTELSELLRQAAPPPDDLDVAALRSRVRDRRRRRVARRGALAAVVGLVLVAGALALVGRGGGSRQVDVEGGGRVTTTSSSGLTTTTGVSSTTASGSAAVPPLPRDGEVVPSTWLATVDLIAGDEGVGVVSGATTCPSCTVGAAGAPAALAVTTDGGATWRVQGDPLPTGWSWGQPVQVGFESSTVGDVMVDGKAYATSDGRTWKRLPSGDGGVTSLTLAGGTIWLVTRYVPFCGGRGCPTGELWTADVGKPATSPATVIPSSDLMARTGVATGVLDVGTQQDIELGHGQLEATSDSGVTWRKVDSPCTASSPNELAAADAQRWWLLCQAGSGMNQGTIEMHSSLDAGRTWTGLASASPTGHGIGGLSDEIIHSFAVSWDGQVVWATTIAGLEVSTDGGATWASAPGASGDFSSATISTAGPRSAWLVAPGQGLWRSNDGVHWTH